MDVLNLFASLAALVGFGAFVTVLINILKLLGWVKDGTAATWSAGFNLVGVIGLFFLKIYRPDYDLGEVDNLIGSFATVLAVIAGFVVQVGSSKIFYNIVRYIPVIGKSNTPKML